MNILIIMIPLSLLLSAGFVASFIWLVKTGQYDDTVTPPYRMLEDETNIEEPHHANNS